MGQAACTCHWCQEVLWVPRPCPWGPTTSSLPGLHPGASTLLNLRSGSVFCLLENQSSLWSLPLCTYAWKSWLAGAAGEGGVWLWPAPVPSTAELCRGARWVPSIITPPDPLLEEVNQRPATCLG